MTLAHLKSLAVCFGMALPMSALAAPSDADLHAVMDRQAERIIALDPEIRSMLGVAGDGLEHLDGELTDVSLQRRERMRSLTAQMRAEVAAFDPGSLKAQERWSRAFALWFYDAQLELMGFEWSPASINAYAVDQLYSPPTMLPQFMDNHHRLADERDAAMYVRRLEAIGPKLDQVVEVVDMQARHGVIPPRVALDGLVEQIGALLAPEPAKSVFVGSLERRLEGLEGIEPARRETLLAEARKAVAEQVNPAYGRLLARLTELQARMPESRGVWSLPDGDAFYDAALRWNTSTDLGADEIHRIGLSEVARIEREMDAILVSQGMEEGSVVERIDRLADDPRLNYEDSPEGRAALLADIRRILDELEPHIPQYFSRVPEQPMEVRPVPEYAQANAPGGAYFPPALDGSRPGLFLINLGDVTSNTRWSIPTLTYHEGVPGHHFQIAIAQTLTELPILRRHLNPSAFTEGWALYAEQLAAEMGVYRDNPWGDLGRLQAEMFRAVRLVVDTGLHRKRWTPDQAVAYMREKTGMSEHDVRIEINRYLVWPGQACSYKIGHLKMVALRTRAQERLGERFDIRAFHDLVLGGGALPLSVLEAIVEEWIEATLRT